MRGFFPLPFDSLYSSLCGTDRWVLLDCSLQDRTNRFSYLFTEPEQVIATRDYKEVIAALDELDRAVSGGMWAAGAVSYEAGYGVEGKLLHLAPPQPQSPLVWFGLYRRPMVFDHRAGEWLGEKPAAADKARKPGWWAVSGLELDADESRFSADVERVWELIAAGRTYQVNYTRRWNFSFDGDPLEFYRALRTAQPVPYGAMISDGDWRVLSLSPELFFRTDRSGLITTRPMKGTIGRGLDLRGDYRQAARLRCDRKNRAENLMIVDLLRNDLGRICRTGSVRVPDLFRVERYRSLLQMTSTVEGQLREGAGVAEVMGKIFPSGSVTGAPKISTMEIIAGLEDTPRGVYTRGNRLRRAGRGELFQRGDPHGGTERRAGRAGFGLRDRGRQQGR
ncbi:MAG: aminodeoxychorismate synthase component I [Candidatus Glassbacteria bacterium]|nr:aminodeoxychorismate synthase component I [Candidatus Glassbacteria bacterium]